MTTEKVCSRNYEELTTEQAQQKYPALRFAELDENILKLISGSDLNPLSTGLNSYLYRFYQNNLAVVKSGEFNEKILVNAQRNLRIIERFTNDNRQQGLPVSTSELVFYNNEGFGNRVCILKILSKAEYSKGLITSYSHTIEFNEFSLNGIYNRSFIDKFFTGREINRPTLQTLFNGHSQNVQTLNIKIIVPLVNGESGEPELSINNDFKFQWSKLSEQPQYFSIDIKRGESIQYPSSVFPICNTIAYLMDAYYGVQTDRE